MAIVKKDKPRRHGEAPLGGRPALLSMRWSPLAGLLFGALSLGFGTFTAADNARPPSELPRLERICREARARWQKETNSVEAAWQFGRACYGWAERATNDAQ